MQHIIYLSDRARVCMEPQRLGHEFITTYNKDADDPASCKECSQLLFAHNERAFVEEAYYRSLYNDPEFTIYDKRPLEFAPIIELNNPHGVSYIEGGEDRLTRGMLYGMLFSMPVWIVIGVIVWAVFFRG